MGCSICLDGFGEDAEKGTRPLALPCGHIFHKACGEGWLKACRIKNDPVCCPLCKAPLGATRPLTLWPSDFKDLDIYLTHANKCVQNQRAGPSSRSGRVMSAAAALDRHMARVDQATLLSNLLDFRQHLQAYVMAVNNVSLYEYGDSERMFGLMRDVSQDDAIRKDVEAAVRSLTSAADLFKETVVGLEEMRRETARKMALATADLAKATKLRAAYEDHEATKVKEMQRMNEDAERSRRLHLHLKKELQSVDRERAQLRETRRLLEQDVSSKVNEANQARLSALQAAAHSRGEADSKVNELTKYVKEQERLREEAVEARKRAVEKANRVADLNRRLSSKLKEARQAAKKQRPSAGPGSSSISDRKGKGKQEDYLSDASDLEREDASEVRDDAQTRAEFEELSRRFSQEARAGTQPTDPVVIDDDDLDAELGDANYPMPQIGRSDLASYLSSGLGVFRRPPFASRAGSDSSRPQMALSTSHVSLDDDDEDDDGAVQFLGRKRKRNDGSSQPLQDAQSEPAQDARSASPAQPFMPGPLPDQRATRSRTGAAPQGMGASLPTNSELVERLMHGSVQLGPRRRAR